MRKILLLMAFLLIFVYACQPKEVMQKPSEIQTQQPAESTGDTTTDSFGSDVSSVNSEDEELGSGELGDMDSGFSDVENI